MSKRIIIAGGRDFEDYDYLLTVCRKLLTRADTIISGCANGADKLGEQFAEKNGITVERFPADWDKHGKAAGHIRNHQMSLQADALIAFWDGKSRGTKNMIENAHKARLETHVYYYASGDSSGN